MGGPVIKNRLTKSPADWPGFFCALHLKLVQDLDGLLDLTIGRADNAQGGHAGNDIPGFAAKTVPFTYTLGGRGEGRFPKVRHF